MLFNSPTSASVSSMSCSVKMGKRYISSTVSMGGIRGLLVVSGGNFESDAVAGEDGEDAFAEVDDRRELISPLPICRNMLPAMKIGWPSCDGLCTAVCVAVGFDSA